MTVAKPRRSSPLAACDCTWVQDQGSSKGVLQFGKVKKNAPNDKGSKKPVTQTHLYTSSCARTVSNRRRGLSFALTTKLRNYKDSDKLLLYLLFFDVFQFRRRFGCSYVVMELWNLNLATSRGGVTVAFTVSLCVLPVFLLIGLVYYTIFSLNLIEYSYNYITT